MKFTFYKIASVCAAISGGACSTKMTVPEKSIVIKSPVVPAVFPSGYSVRCNGRVINVDEILRPIVRSMVAQKIPYSQNPSNEWRDCSGNFLRLSSYVASTCKDQAHNLVAPPGVSDYRSGTNNKAPNTAKARSSRGIAKWYHLQGRFTPIFYDDVKQVSRAPKDLIKNRQNIKVGSVLWFSRLPPKASNGISALFNGKGRGAHINHMAVVTHVDKDSKGRVVRFKMYHGQGKGKLGSVTDAHFWVWPERYLAKGRKQYPPFGFWGQYLVGIGLLLPI